MIHSAGMPACPSLHDRVSSFNGIQACSDSVIVSAHIDNQREQQGDCRLADGARTCIESAVDGVAASSVSTGNVTSAGNSRNGPPGMLCGQAQGAPRQALNQTAESDTIIPASPSIIHLP